MFFAVVNSLLLPWWSKGLLQHEQRKWNPPLKTSGELLLMESHAVLNLWVQIHEVGEQHVQTLGKNCFYYDKIKRKCSIYLKYKTSHYSRALLPSRHQSNDKFSWLKRGWSQAHHGQWRNCCHLQHSWLSAPSMSIVFSKWNATKAEKCQQPEKESCLLPQINLM